MLLTFCAVPYCVANVFFLLTVGLGSSDGVAVASLTSDIVSVVALFVLLFCTFAQSDGFCFAAQNETC